MSIGTTIFPVNRNQAMMNVLEVLCLLTNDNIVQCLIDSRILKLKPGIKQAAGNHSLPFEQDGTEFAENQFDHKARRGHKGRTV